VLDGLQYEILKRIAPFDQGTDTDPYHGRSKLRILLGDSFLEEIRDKTVIDFGCGEGTEALEMAHTAGHVIGLELASRDYLLKQAAIRAAEAGLSERCEFTTGTTRKADIVVSIDAFEHFDDPAGILEIMFGLLKPGGLMVTSFGPTWYHPYGGHLVRHVCPWAHFIFSEASLMRWRSGFRNDGATRFHEIEGGLNKMTIRRFEQLVCTSPFTMEQIEPVPIRKLRWLHCRATREWSTAVVRARLRKP